MRLASVTGLVLATAAAGLSACGGDDSLSRAEYVKQANAICRDANAQMSKVGNPNDMGSLSDYVRAAKGITSGAVDDMAALEPPKSLRADHKAHIADGRAVVALGDKLFNAVRTGDEAAIHRLTEEGERYDRVSDDRAKRMGLTDCAGDGA